jgi:ATP-binding cassette subfamily B protein
MEVIQVCRREKEQATRYSEINGKLRDAHLKSIFWYALFFPTVELLSVVALGIIVVQGGQRIEAGTATFGEFFLFWTYLTRLFTPVRDLAEKYNLLQSAMASSERVFSVLDSDTSLPEGEHHSDEDLAPLNEIRFEGVSFAYDPKTPVLQNVSFSVKKGETVAIVGATGAGKSTIINLLLRFHDPVSGSITLNGDDIRESSLVEHRERFGLVLQDVAVLSRTLGENIRFDRDIQRSKILEALEQVNGQDIIARQSQGLDEPMMERGRTLSSGERQLISFARALAGNPEILVLDEATSHVDTETETRIQAAIDKMVEGRTSVIVAHRLSTVRKADRILVLHHGQLRESGTHDELVSQDGIYAKLVKLQFQSR